MSSSVQTRQRRQSLFTSGISPSLIQRSNVFLETPILLAAWAVEMTFGWFIG